MQSNYKRLGDYIQEVNIRNKDLNDYPLLGVSVKKVFIPSIANTIGTDFSTYKVVQRNQFTYIPDTSRRGEKIGLAFLDSYNYALVSQAYTVFEIIDEYELNPEYLMMWFKRPEFDRYARVKSHGSVREIFEWQTMCDVFLPIPSPEKQLEIVREYNIIQHRIRLNSHFISKLEETARAIYKKWFVDFEFPGKNGLPYKSSGGEMVESELRMIPKDWEGKSIGDAVETLGGGTPSTNESKYWCNGEILWYSPTDLTKNNSLFSRNTAKKITNVGLQKSSAKLFPSYCLLITSRATIGKIAINTKEACTNQGFITLIPTEKLTVYFLLEWANTQLDNIKSLATGSTFLEISKADFRRLKFVEPTIDVLLNYECTTRPIYHLIRMKNEENEVLEKLRELLFTKMTKVEVDIEFA